MSNSQESPLKKLLIYAAIIVAVVLLLIALGKIDPSGWGALGPTLSKLKPDPAPQSDVSVNVVPVNSTPIANNPNYVNPNVSGNDSKIPVVSVSTPNIVPPVDIAPPINMSTPILPKNRLVKTIRLHRQDKGIIHIAEVYAYDMNGKMLTRSDFESITLDSVRDMVENNPEFIMDNNLRTITHTGNYGASDNGNHWINMVLKSPTELANVGVYVKQDGWVERSIGTNVILLGVNGETLMTAPLTAKYSDQQFRY